MARIGSKPTRQSPLIIGVAGIMGSGKSTVARVFEDLGAKRIDADTVGKAVLRDEKVKQAVVEVFGKRVIDRDGEVDIAKLGRAAFADESSAQKLDQLTRAALVKSIRESIQELGHLAEVVVVDAALLPEWDSRDWIDVLVVVDSDEETAIRRSCCRSRLSARNVRSRMRHQFSRQEKSREADIIIPNYGSLEDLKGRARRIFWKLLEASGKG